MPQKPMPVSREQVLEWCENPVTLRMKYLAHQQVEDFETRNTEVFYPFEPQKTQEVLAGINACVDTWEDVVETLEGQGVWLDEFSPDEEESE